MAEVAARLLAAAERIDKAAHQKKQRHHKKLKQQQMQEEAGSVEGQGAKGKDGADDVHSQQEDREKNKGAQEAAAASQWADSAKAPASAASSRAPVLAGGPAAVSRQLRACSVCGQSGVVLMKCSRRPNPGLPAVVLQGLP